VIKDLRVELVVGQVTHGHSELAVLLTVLDTLDGLGEAHPVTHTSLVHTALNVVVQHSTGRVRRDLLAKVLLEGVVGKLKALLGSVGPQVAVHGAVHWLAVLV